MVENLDRKDSTCPFWRPKCPMYVKIKETKSCWVSRSGEQCTIFNTVKKFLILIFEKFFHKSYKMWSFARYEMFQSLIAIISQ